MFSYKKVGGLHFVRVGRLGFSFYLQKPRQGYRTVDRGQVQLDFG